MQTLEKLPTIPTAKGSISIIVAVLNHAHTLQRCIDSVVKQTYPYKELIILDGGSVDGSVDIIRRNASSISHWVSEPDRGIYHAFNKGVRLSTGEWLIFLGSDDILWKEDVLQRVAEQFDTAYPHCKVIYGPVANVSQEGDILEIRGMPWSAYQALPTRRWTFDHQGIFQHRSLFETHGLFDESYLICGDQEFLLRELKSAPALYLEEVIVAGFGWGGTSSRPANLHTLIEERRRALRANGLPAGMVVSPLIWIKMVCFEALRTILGKNFARFLGDLVAKAHAAKKRLSRMT